MAQTIIWKYPKIELYCPELEADGLDFMFEADQSETDEKIFYRKEVVLPPLKEGSDTDIYNFVVYANGFPTSITTEIYVGAEVRFYEPVDMISDVKYLSVEGGSVNFTIFFDKITNFYVPVDSISRIAGQPEFELIYKDQTVNLNDHFKAYPEDATNTTITWSVDYTNGSSVILYKDELTHEEDMGDIIRVTATVHGGLSITLSEAEALSLSIEPGTGGKVKLDKVQEFEIYYFEAPEDIIAVESITIEDVPSQLVVGQELLLADYVTVLPEDATFKDRVVWSNNIAMSNGNYVVNLAGNKLTVADASVEGKLDVNASVSKFKPNSASTYAFSTEVMNAETVTTDVSLTGFIKVENVYLSDSAWEDGTDGPTFELIPTVAPSNASIKDVSWAFKNPESAVASLEGNVVTPPTGFLEVKSDVLIATVVGGLETADYSVEVTVTYNPNPELVAESEFVAVTDLNGTVENGVVGTPLELTATIAPSNATATIDDLVWAVADSGTAGASLSEGKFVNATSPGTCKVTATIENGGPAHRETKVFEYQVTFEPDFISVTDLSDLESSYEFDGGLVLALTTTPENASNQEVTYAVTNKGTSDATIGGALSNTLTWSTAGTIELTATVVNGTADGENYVKTYDIELTMPFVEVSGVTLSSAVAVVGEPLDLIANVTPEDATNKEVTFSIEDNGGDEGAYINDDNQLITTQTGTVKVKAVIIDGLLDE